MTGKDTWGSFFVLGFRYHNNTDRKSKQVEKTDVAFGRCDVFYSIPYRPVNILRKDYVGYKMVKFQLDVVAHACAPKRDSQNSRIQRLESIIPHTVGVLNI